MNEEFEKYWLERKTLLQADCATNIIMELELGRYTARAAFAAGQAAEREKITRLRDALEWFRDFYIGTVHDADHDRKAHKKIVEALGGDK
jgi:hypothetical protein